MAALLHDRPVTSLPKGAELLKNPHFRGLQETLRSDVTRSSVVPYSLLSDRLPQLEYSEVEARCAKVMSSLRELADKTNHPQAKTLLQQYNQYIVESDSARHQALSLLHSSAHEMAPSLLASQQRTVCNYHNLERDYLQRRFASTHALLAESLKGRPPYRPERIRLPEDAVRAMSRMYEEETRTPSQQQISELSVKLGILPKQVRSWFANKRNRNSSGQRTRKKEVDKP